MPRVYEHMIRQPISSCEPRQAICVDPRATVAEAIAAMKEHDFAVPLQFTNFRD